MPLRLQPHNDYIREALKVVMSGDLFDVWLCEAALPNGNNFRRQ